MDATIHPLWPLVHHATMCRERYLRTQDPDALAELLDTVKRFDMSMGGRLWLPSGMPPQKPPRPAEPEWWPTGGRASVVCRLCGRPFIARGHGTEDKPYVIEHRCRHADKPEGLAPRKTRWQRWTG